MKARFPRTLTLVALFCGLLGCGSRSSDRIEWPTMGTVAAVQCRAGVDSAVAVRIVRQAYDEIVQEFNAFDAHSPMNLMASRSDAELCRAAKPIFRPCYCAAFDLARLSGGAFNPRWRGPRTLDFGAIAKGFAVDYAAERLEKADIKSEILLDLGGNLKAVRGDWSVGVRDPQGEGVSATVRLRAGESLATSAEYFRGKHIYDARTGRPVSNDVVSVSVLCRAALWADGLSTTLFVLGPDEGCAFLNAQKDFFEPTPSVLWILSDGRTVTYGANRFLTE